MKHIDHFLILPPFVRMIDFGDVGVIACAERIKFSHIVRVSKLFQHAAVIGRDAVGNIRVPVEISPVEKIRRAVMSPRVQIVARAFGSHRINVGVERLSALCCRRPDKRKHLFRVDRGELKSDGTMQFGCA